jgi:hypothetical protein
MSISRGPSSRTSRRTGFRLDVARPGENDQLTQRQLEVEALEIVLPRANDFDKLAVI